MGDSYPKHGDNTFFRDTIVGQRVPDILEQFQYNVNTKTLTSTTVNGGSISQSDSMAVLQSGTNTNSGAMLESKNSVRYRPGFEGFALFTGLFETGGIPDTNQYIGIFNINNGFFVGYKNEDFVVGYRNNGVDTTVTSENWNGDERHEGIYSQIDYTKLTIFRITWGWLGTAPVKFETLLPRGEWITLHTFDFPSTRITPHVKNPVLPMCMDISKGPSSTSTNAVIKSASWCGGIVGIDTGAADRFFTGGITKDVSTEEVMINFRNMTTFHSEVNRVVAEGVKISISSEGNRPAILKIYRNLPITSPTWTPKDSVNSIMEVDTVGTVTPDDSNLLMAYDLAKSDSLLDDLRGMDFKISPGETVTITGQSQVSNEMSFTARWKEMF